MRGIQIIKWVSNQTEVILLILYSEPPVRQNPSIPDSLPSVQQINCDPKSTSSYIGYPFKLEI